MNIGVLDSSCSHHNSADDFLHKLNSTQLFDIDLSSDTPSVSLKEVDDKKKISKFFETIDYYLHYDFVEKLRYEQYSLNDHFWALKSQ